MYPTPLSTMKRRFTCSAFLPPLALILQLVIIVGLALILRSGSLLPDLYIILVDAGNYSKTVTGKTFTGLPDSHDYSKYKDFFKIYPGLYCSGNIKNGHYNADFCSNWGSQLFDLQRVWRVWGFDLMGQNLIGATPKIIFIGLVVGAGTALLSVILGVVSFCVSYWGTVLTTLIAWVSSIVILATATVTHIAISKLLSSTPSIKLIGDGTITIRRGEWFNRAMWIASAVALISALLWSIIACVRRRSRSQRHAPIPLVQRDASGHLVMGYKGGATTSYEHLVMQPDMQQHLKSPVTARESAYEPMMHRPVGY